VEAELHKFLISTLDGTEWSASGPDHFTPGVRTPSTQLTMPQSLDVVAKRKKFLHCPIWEFNPG